MPLFSSIEIHDWRQFAQINIDLSHQTTVLTGTNGSGKTTILNTLSKHFGWNFAFVSTPYVGKRRARRLWSDVYSGGEGLEDLDPGQVEIGAIRYSDGAICKLFSDRFVQANYHLNFSDIKPVQGLYIPSHRPIATYNPINEIPTNPVEVDKFYQQYQQMLFQAFGSSPRHNPGAVQKRSIIALALFGEGNSAVAANPEYQRVFEELQEKLRLVLPREIGFRRLEVRMPEVVLVTDSGNFSLDAMSGGINALFGIVWQVYMSGVDTPEYVVAIDEPENHLHPSMQRILLPNLAIAFPQTRFVVATHSPFIVSSFPEAAVYGLFQNEKGRVISTRLSAKDLAGTPNKVLREILDVDSNLPVWVEQQIIQVLDQHQEAPPEQRADLILNELADLGISDALAEYAKKQTNEKT